MDRGGFAAPSLASSARTSASACASRAEPGRGRGPRSIARSSTATASRGALSSAPNRASWCLRTPAAAPAQGRRQRRFRDRARECAGGVSASGSPPELSAVMFQRSQQHGDPARQRAVGRHQQRRAACHPSTPHATPPRWRAPPPPHWPPRSPSIRRIACSMALARIRPRRAAPRQAIGRGGRTQRFARQNFAAVRRGRNARRRRAARSRCAREARAWRIADGSGAPPTSPPRPRRRGRYRGRAAPRRRGGACNGREQFRGRRHRAGRARRDHRRGESPRVCAASAAIRRSRRCCRFDRAALGEDLPATARERL